MRYFIVGFFYQTGVYNFYGNVGIINDSNTFFTEPELKIKATESIKETIKNKDLGGKIFIISVCEIKEADYNIFYSNTII